MTPRSLQPSVEVTIALLIDLLYGLHVAGTCQLANRISVSLTAAEKYVWPPSLTWQSSREWLEPAWAGDGRCWATRHHNEWTLP